MSLILTIDTDVNFCTHLGQKLTRAQSPYGVENIVPNTTLPKEALPGIVAEEVRQRTEVALVLVDLVIYSTDDPELDTTGIAVAEEIGRALPQVPVFIVTERASGYHGFEAVSKANLAMVDGVLIKTFLIGPAGSAERIPEVVAAARRKRAALARLIDAPDTTNESRTPVRRLIIATGPTVKHSVGESDWGTTPVSVRQEVDKLGADRFWAALDHLLPRARGTIHLVKPGRSGAAVFELRYKKHRPSGGQGSLKGALLKVSADHSIIQAEANAYDEILNSGIDKKHFPQPITRDPVALGGLSGFVVEFASGFRPFHDVAAKTTSVARWDHWGSELGGILRLLYGDPVSRQLRPWVECFCPAPEVLSGASEVVSRHRPLFEAKLGKKETRGLSEYLAGEGKLPKLLAEWNAEVRVFRLHGDLNTGNIMCDGSGSIMLVDFASRCEAPAWRDMAKLQRDLMCRVADRGTPQEWGWTREREWGRLLSPPRATRDGVTFGSSLAARLLATIVQAIGVGYAEDQEPLYCAASLVHCLSAIGHPDFSTPKRVTAAVAAWERCRTLRSILSRKVAVTV